MKSNILTNKEYLKIAIPFMLSTVTQPLLGAVDTAVVGRLGNSTYIGGISIGVVIFNTLYWLLGFLRVSTTAFSAQVKGRSSVKEKTISFTQPMFIAIGVSVLFLIFRELIFNSFIYFINPEEEVRNVAFTYYNIVIWGAPFVLINYVILGWLMGQMKIAGALFMQVGGNSINILLNIILVYYFNFDIKGVAYATLVAQIISTLIGIYLILKNEHFKKIEIKELFNKANIKDIFLVNSNLMLRTSCLLIQSNVFTAMSTAFGTEILAANAILLNVQSIISYILDGIANASSVFSGKAVGEKNKVLMRATWNMSIKWGAILAMLMSVLYLIVYKDLISVFTNVNEVANLAEKYGLWTSLYPLLACGGLIFYGVFTGAAVTRPIFISTFLSLLAFLSCCKVTIPIYGNHGLWISLLVFYFGRTIFLIPSLKRTIDVI
ncbi:MATE family efflux transporter [Clostridium sp. SHJSY1]|uniref:MATE family efflux transporter n=1 Tax=Clostridium sp. SHJSY1 TaxID=2942483 RepID=UPI0028752A4E|nr:MATE family efflux transporter [Clostridium sp. SHJSY1]MDS0526884.1 MATE family efflux transporter [Clostridium sp. SHJSY1]